MIQSALVVGAGLLGTSAGMALQGGDVEVWFSDRDPRAAALAADLAGGRVWDGRPVDVALVAVPVSAISEVVIDLIRRGVSRTIMDFGSVKVKPQVEVQTLAAKMSLSTSSFVPSHPMAGRERSGPEAARGDLFQGRVWVLTPGPETDELATADARAVIDICGGEALEMESAAHDRAVALVSHLPQVLASALAATLVQAESSSVALAGQGIRDVTRIAASDPGLWSGILAGNREYLSRSLDEVLDRLVDLKSALAKEDDRALYRLIAAGNEGRLRLPGKHGGLSTQYVVIPVVIDDRPGQLAALFAAAGESSVNIEDLSMEHSPGQPMGLVELSVAPEAADRFIDFLKSQGWRVHPPRLTADTTTE